MVDGGGVEDRAWRGVVIAESLQDPTLLNGSPVYRVPQVEAPEE